MLLGMSEAKFQRCPPHLLREALELALASAAPEQHGAIIDALRPLAEQGVDVFAALSIAQDADDHLLGAAWLQPQVGRTATLWPPGVRSNTDAGVARRLAQHALQSATQLPVAVAQALLEKADSPFATDLPALGFRHLAELKYLMLRVPTNVVAVDAAPVSLVPHATSDMALFKRLLLGTYEATLDCPALSGLRMFEDIVAGYQAVGEFDGALWFIVRWDNQPAGVLLLAAYPEDSNWELVYMGVLPAFRGRSIGSHVLSQLRERASREGVASVLLAVDATNTPALNMYARAGYLEWARRHAYIKRLS